MAIVLDNVTFSWVFSGATFYLLLVHTLVPNDDDASQARSAGIRYI